MSQILYSFHVATDINTSSINIKTRRSHTHRHASTAYINSHIHTNLIQSHTQSHTFNRLWFIKPVLKLWAGLFLFTVDMDDPDHNC